MSYMNQSEFAPAAGIQELSFDEIQAVSGANTKQNICYGTAAGGGAVSVIGMVAGIAAAATPVGMAVAIGFGMAGLFFSSAGAATCR